MNAGIEFIRKFERPGEGVHCILPELKLKHQASSRLMYAVTHLEHQNRATRVGRWHPPASPYLLSQGAAAERWAPALRADVA